MPEREDTTKEQVIDFEPSVNRPVPCLIVLNSPSSSTVGRMYRLEKDEIVLGRGSRSDILVDDDGISRYHTRIVSVPGGRKVVDLGSTNGTYLNGSRVEEAPLYDGDRIQMGRSTVLKYTVQDSLDERYHQNLYDSAVKDGLTGVYNRRYFLERLHAEFQHSARHKRSLGILLFDLDHFKKVNDTHGHRAGDAVLRAVSDAVMKALRGGDVLARYGGEEFACLLREADRSAAIRFGERLRKTVRDRPVPWEGGRIPVTISVGVVSYDGSNFDSADGIVRAADERLYEAKRAGRDRVVG